MFKNLFTIIKYIVIGILGIAVWWYLIFYALPDWSVYKRLKSQVVSTYCNIRPNSETCINIKKRKKDNIEIEKYCRKIFPLEDPEKSGMFGEKYFKCYCENMNERGHIIKDGDCRTIFEFLQDPLKDN